MADSISSSSSRDDKLDEMKQAHEKKMALLRAKQQKEESDLRESGEAAVNHIRKSANDRVATARSEADSKVGRESESIGKDYSALKKRSQENAVTTEKEINNSRDHADQTIDANRERENSSLEKSQEKLKGFLEKQRELRAATERKNAEAIRETEKQNGAKLRKATDDNQRELRALETDHKERIREITQENKASYEEAKDQGHRRISQVKRDDDVQLQHEIKQDNDTFTRVHKKSHDDIQRTQQIGQQRLSQVVEENQRKLEGNQEKNISLNEKLQREYSQEGQRVEMEGKADVDARTQKFNRVLAEQKVQQKEELHEVKTDHEKIKEQMRTEGEAHIKDTVVKMRDELHRKENQFESQYKSADKANHETLSNQKEIFLKEQYKQRRREDDAVYVDETRKGDKFYKPQSFSAQIEEHEDKYVLTAKVPAYEKDNVEVRVKDGKVTLSSARQFKNSVKDGDAKMETSTSQSYRQEIALLKPADTKRVLTSVSDDGVIRSIIPKKGFTKI